MSELEIAVLRDRGTEASVTTLTLAMLNLPLHNAVFLGQVQEAHSQIRGMVETLLRHASGGVFAARLDGRNAGVFRMRSCRGRQSTSPPVADTSELDLKDTTGRVSHWQSVWTRHDPEEHHWHLGSLGVAPDLQGHGIGTAMNQHFCGLIDTRGASAYLETDQIRTVHFYERFGFRVIDEPTSLASRSTSCGAAAKQRSGLPFTGLNRRLSPCGDRVDRPGILTGSPATTRSRCAPP